MGDADRKWEVWRVCSNPHLEEAHNRHEEYHMGGGALSHNHAWGRDHGCFIPLKSWTIGLVPIPDLENGNQTLITAWHRTVAYPSLSVQCTLAVSWYFGQAYFED